jgi:hypothetical protein
MPKQSLHNKETAIIKLMNLSVAEKIPRYELSGDITSGRMNFEVLMNRIKDNNLLPLIQGNIQPPQVPMDPGIFEDFLMDSRIGLPPEEFQEGPFLVQWVIMRSKHPPRVDLNNLTEADIQTCRDYLDRRVQKVRARYQAALKQAKRQAADRELAYYDRVRQVHAAYDRKLAEYTKQKEIAKQEQIKYDEKVVKLNELLSQLFSENAINAIRDKLDNRQYQDALNKLKRLISTGTNAEGHYLREVLESTIYKTEMNFPVFLKAVDLVHTMLMECNMPKSKEEKIEDLE